MYVAVLPLLLLAGASASTPNTPVGRVVELMGNLAKQIEQEGEKEEALYETYVCWAKSIISQKTNSNAAAESRINELERYIADIAAGRVEFTSERADLTKELEELNADIEAATAMREREKADFEEAAHEMDQTVTALQSAIEVLKEATAAHQQGTMLIAQTSFEHEATSAAALSRAVELGQRFLTKGDALFLRRLLSAEVPTADWKKLNRKATFKMSYKARSGKIQSVLASLLATFEANLKEATDNEAKAQSTYDKLMENKHESKAATEDALLEMEKENGVRGMTVEESQAEVDSLKEQVSEDTKYIAQVEKSLAEKKEEWKERQALRAGEIQAFSKAISILHSDDARDLMKKSYASQGFSFLQTSAEDASRGTAAAAALREAARGADAGRRGSLMALAARAAAPSHFKAVVEAIDNMVAVLQSEEAEDLEIKERCEADRSRDSRQAAVISREMDEMTDKIAQLRQDIEKIKATVAEKQQQIKDNQEELAEATRIREAEKAEYGVNKKFDEDTHKLIISSREVLTTFYSENGLMLVQGKARQPAVSQAGEAPPPPPATWEAPYGGKTDESTGVLAILGMLAEDVEKDMAAALAAENEAIAAYEETKSALEASIAALEADIVALNATQAEKEEEVETTKGDRRESKKSLAAVMDALAKAAPGCDFFAVNYQVRTRNRQVEMDGLTKAKAILEGAAFSKVDENREIKPGDAFLQRVGKHQ